MSGSTNVGYTAKNKSIKCTVVGDSGVGKTCLLLTYVTNKYPDCVPASFEWHLAGTAERCQTYPSVQVNGIRYNLDFSDTLGLDEYQKLRLIAYMTTDVFVVCYDISCPESLKNARGKWLKETKEVSADVPVILVGTKLDLRLNHAVLASLRETNEHTVLHQEGQDAAKQMGAIDYIECSALTHEGVRSVFLTAAHAACMNKRQEIPQKQCCRCVIL